MFFFFNDTATTEIYTLSLHDALPISVVGTRPILASQVEEQLVLAQSQGQKVPEDSAGRNAARRQGLSQMGDEELLVQQAERDTTIDRKRTRLNSSHGYITDARFCFEKKNT